MSLRTGDVFAGYTVERELGAGGMGSVFLARHPRLPRDDALKLLKAELGTDPTFVKRFAGGELPPNSTIPISFRWTTPASMTASCGSACGTSTASMRRRRWSRRRAACRRSERSGITKIAAALDYAHRHLLLHRDVKPANILLCAGADDGERERVFLADFGVAKPIGGGPSVTATGDVLGTLDYVAPEQIRGHQPDTRSDIYALGGVLYKLLTGSVPYPGEIRRPGLRTPGRTGAATERLGSVAARRAGRGGRHRDGQEAR